MHFFYKKKYLFIKKKCPLLFIKKNSMLQIVIYKKINFWEEYTPLLSTTDYDKTQQWILKTKALPAEPIISYFPLI